MKQIDTVVEDIYDVFYNGTCPDDDTLDSHVSAIRRAIVRQITEVREGPQNLRLSQIGKPNRVTWYDLQDMERKQLDATTRIKFLFGDIIEELILLLVKTAGHKVTDEQKEVCVEGVLGHMDAKIDGVICDIKSASPFGFKKFADNNVGADDAFGYIPQVSSYAEAEGEDRATFLAMNKVTGELALADVHSMEMINASDRVKELKAMDTLPERCHSDVPDGASGNRTLDKACGWCDYKEGCWADINDGIGLRKFQYSTYVKYYTHISKQPRVPEITT